MEILSIIFVLKNLILTEDLSKNQSENKNTSPKVGQLSVTGLQLSVDNNSEGCFSGDGSGPGQPTSH